MAQIVLALVLIVAGVLVLLRGLRTLSRPEPGAAPDPGPDTDEADEPGATRTDPGRYLALAGVALVAVGVLALLT